MALPVFVTVMVMAALIVFLSFLAPEHSEKRFWTVIRKVRETLDLCSYWVINVIAIVFIAMTVGAAIYSIFK